MDAYSKGGAYLEMVSLLGFAKWSVELNLGLRDPLVQIVVIHKNPGVKYLICNGAALRNRPRGHSIIMGTKVQ